MSGSRAVGLPSLPPRGLPQPKARALAVARPAIGLGYLIPALAPPPQRQPASRVRAATVDPVALRCVGLALFAEIFLQKVAVPLSKTTQISATLIVGFVALGFLVVSGRAVVDTTRFALFALAMVVLVATQLIGGEAFSRTSLLLLMATYAIYVVRLQDRPGTFRASLGLYQTMMAIVAGAAVLQYVAQFRLPADLVFPLETHLGPLLYQGYNNISPITYGSAIYKSNGVFLGEPSLLSQGMALSFIIERLFFRRTPFQLAFLAGLVVSYSGTGLLLLLAAAPFLIYKTGGLRLLLLLLPIGLVVLLAGKMLDLGVVANRAGEFSSRDSSGFARFISIFYLLGQYPFADAHHFLFGMGAGTIEGVMKKVTYLAHDPTWGKLLFEYGLIGALAFFPYMLTVIFVGTPSPILAFCLLFAYLFLGGNLLSPFYNFLIAALLAWQRPELAPAPARSRPSTRFADQVRVPSGGVWQEWRRGKLAKVPRPCKG
ncbi:MAG: hypothetical protein U1E53_09220 [Dongiaceae bacterium]